MVTGLILAGVIAGHLPVLPGLALATAWGHPLLIGPALAAAGWLARRGTGGSGEPPEVTFHRVLASELRAGLSPRQALAAACGAAPGLELEGVQRLAEAGRPLEEAAQRLAGQRRLRPAAAALAVAARTGGSVAAMFDALTAEAVDEERLRLERRSLTVQARLSVAIVGGFPLLFLIGQIATGSLKKVLALGAVGAVIVGVGVGLLVAGLTTVGWLLRKARR
jgi:Flp pilus assembly protein TadB